jgi:hypothetical protein
MFNEYGNIGEMAINFLIWFLLGTVAAYALFTLLEYIDGRKD